jgi:hypothetical protein
MIEVPRNYLHLYPANKYIYQVWTRKIGTDDELKENFVSTSEYKTQQFPIDKYAVKTETKEYSAKKLKINMKFRDLILRFGHENQKVIYLDCAPQNRTTKCLLDIPWIKKGDLIVPNLDPNYENQSEKVISRYESFRETMRDSIQTNEPHGYHIGADFCGTFDGRKGQFGPIDDLWMMFSNHILAEDGGVFWLTLSIRKTGETREKTTKEAKKFIRETAKQFGYSLRLMYKDCYNTMIVLMYVSIFQPKINDEIIVNFKTEQNSNLKRTTIWNGPYIILDIVEDGLIYKVDKSDVPPSEKGLSTINIHLDRIHKYYPQEKRTKQELDHSIIPKDEYKINKIWDMNPICSKLNGRDLKIIMMKIQK